MLSVVNADGSTESGSLVAEIVREGARRMLAAALEAEVNQCITELTAETDRAGRRLVVRNGRPRQRTVTPAADPIKVRAVLVLMGVRLDGTKELVALAEGLRESTKSWADLLRDCRRRGMRDPELVVGDGAMGLWKALAEVFPAARHQRCWVHEAQNISNALPKSAQPGATKATGDLQRRGQDARREGDRSLRENLRHEVAQGRRQDHR